MKDLIKELRNQGCIYEPEESAKFEDRTVVYRTKLNIIGTEFFKYYIKSNTCSCYAFHINEDGSYYSYPLFENRRNAKVIADWELENE